MKTKLLLLTVLFTVVFQSTNAQCSRSGDFLASSIDPENYPISGTVSVIFTTSGTKEIVLENNFATVQGADLRMYLSTTASIEAPESINIAVSPQLLNDNPSGGEPTGSGGPGTSPITGVRTFTLPSNIELADYNFVVIQCIAINERWGHAILGNNTGADCATLSIDENTLSENVNFYPNPARDNIQISNDKELDIEIVIIDLLGKEVFNTKKSSLRKQSISLTSLKTGVYLIQMKADGKTITKKLLKQ